MPSVDFEQTEPITEHGRRKLLAPVLIGAIIPAIIAIIIILTVTRVPAKPAPTPAKTCAASIQDR